VEKNTRSAAAGIYSKFHKGWKGVVYGGSISI